jgi:NAD(P)-dependent dehydrogenase (short-subunit alcohol dehydrogenase family)
VTPRRRALVTGAAGGLGYEVAAALAARGDRVLLADRNVDRGLEAVERIRAATRNDAVEFRPLDLASLAHVRAFAALIDRDDEPLHLLVNNAGILPSLRRQETQEGFELALGIALLGHFALTALLVPALQRAPAPRVVTVTSLVQAYARIDFDDIHARLRYEPTRAYNQSKLAVLMFALELDARARRAGFRLQSLAAHPGIARTAIGDARMNEPPRRLRDSLEVWAFRAAMALAGQSAADGARPILHAATAVDANGGEFYGPGGFQQWSGPPRRVAPSKAALDADARERLWHLATQLTGLRWPT